MSPTSISEIPFVPRFSPLFPTSTWKTSRDMLYTAFHASLDLDQIYVDDIFVECASKGYFLMEFHRHLKNTASFHTVHDGEGNGQQDSLSRRASWEKGHCLCPHIFVSEKTHVDHYLNFESHHYLRVRRCIVKCLKGRLERVCYVTNCLSGFTKCLQPMDIQTMCWSKFSHNGPLLQHPTTPQRQEDQNWCFRSYLTPRGLHKISNMSNQPLGVAVSCNSQNKLAEALVKVKDLTSELMKVWCMKCLVVCASMYLYIRVHQRNREDNGQRLNVHNAAVKWVIELRHHSTCLEDWV